MNQEELIRLMNERRAEEEAKNRLSPEDAKELERIEQQRKLIEDNRRLMAEAYANQIHDREIAAMTQDLEPEGPEPDDAELRITRYEPEGADAREIA